MNQAAEILSRHGAEEELQGGKHEVAGGKVRVYKRAA
jgi:hypothetical protein